MRIEKKYTSYLNRYKVDLKNRQWPNTEIKKAPIWCTVDLRDGNQSLINPMNVSKKLELYHLLVEMGFKEIEIGFPAASSTEFEFTRKLIEENRIPDDVTPQVLVQCKPDLIQRTFKSLEGCKRAIVHLYNSTSIAQRNVVFNKSDDEIIALAVSGVNEILKHTKQTETEIILQYSPESFTGTELAFSKKICEAVIDVWKPTASNKIIINIPATVELATPNIYADQVEWFHRNLKDREHIILSIHTHNDRGTGVASSELGLMAGADRVEGTLFGSGERTGNVDLVCMALNMVTQGVDPGLDISDINRVATIMQRCTGEKIGNRHPYAGELVFTAFSGSHQDAISKGLHHREKNKEETLWDVPYLSIDPKDIGREYHGIIRINSQSGKGGISYILKSEFSIDLPLDLRVEFYKLIQVVSEKQGTEILPEAIFEVFKNHYVNVEIPVKVNDDSTSQNRFKITYLGKTRTISLEGKGTNTVELCVNAIGNFIGYDYTIESYYDSTLTPEPDSDIVVFIKLKLNGISTWGVGIHKKPSKASVLSICSAINRILDVTLTNVEK